jgi:hypothetical protein
MRNGEGGVMALTGERWGRVSGGTVEGRGPCDREDLLDGQCSSVFTILGLTYIHLPY